MYVCMYVYIYERTRKLLDGSSPWLVLVLKLDIPLRNSKEEDEEEA